jgi:hypothetical protein
MVKVYETAILQLEVLKDDLHKINSIKKKRDDEALYVISTNLPE